jgi:hypothetical protein
MSGSGVGGRGSGIGARILTAPIAIAARRRPQLPRVFEWSLELKKKGRAKKNKIYSKGKDDSNQPWKLFSLLLRLGTRQRP